MKMLGIEIVLFLVLFINAYGANQTDINSSDETKPVVLINDKSYIKYSLLLFIILVVLVIIYLRYVKVRKTKVESSLIIYNFDELENVANNIQNNMRVLLTIFGILVSFTLTVQIDKIFLDLSFIT